MVERPQHQLRHVSRQAMHVVAGLRKVAPRELMRLDKSKDLAVNRRAAAARSRPKQASCGPSCRYAESQSKGISRSPRAPWPAGRPRRYSIIQHCIDRVTGVLVSKESRAFIPLSEAQPRARQIAILSLPQSGVAECPPIGCGGPAFDNHDLGDASGRIQFDVPFLEFAPRAPASGMVAFNSAPISL